MREFEPNMITQIDVFLAQILRASQQDEVVGMTSRCKYLAMDVIGLLAFGSSWRTQTAATLQILPRAFASLNPRIYLFMNWPKFHKIDPGLQWLVKERIETFCRKRREDRSGTAGRCWKSEIWGEAGIFVNAGKLQPFHQWLLVITLRLQQGGTTTATEISAVFYYLSRKPIRLRAARLRGTHDLRLGQRDPPRAATRGLQVPPRRHRRVDADFVSHPGG